MSDKKYSSGLSALIYVVLIILPVVLFLLSLGLGAYHIKPMDVVQSLWAIVSGSEVDVDDLTLNLIKTVRLPRLCGAVVVGAGLACSGAVFQGLFKNPLASPYTLGVSNGAGFGAALAIILSLGAVGIQAGAIVFGLLAVSITFILGSYAKGSTATLILAGMLVGSLFASLVSLIKFVADPFEKLPQIVFWLMGSLASLNMQAILGVLPIYIFAMVVLLLFRWRLNILSMGDTEARSFGLNVKRDRAVIIFAASVITALSVSIAGVIGWVGVVIPHFARMLVGPDYRKLLPASLSLGISYLIVIDDLCRLVSATEIPIGVITGIIGAPLFIYFIYKKKVSW